MFDHRILFFSTCSSTHYTILFHQQKTDLRTVDATCVQTGCVCPMHSVRPNCPPDSFSHPMHPTKVLIRWLRPEASGGTQPRWDTTGAPRGYTGPQIHQKRPDELPRQGERPLGDSYLFFKYLLLSSKFQTLKAKISRRYSILGEAY